MPADTTSAGLIPDAGSTLWDAADAALIEAIEPDASSEQVADYIREEEDLPEDWEPTAEIVGLTGPEGNRAVVGDGVEAVELWRSGLYTFDGGDAAGQVADDIAERAGDLWDAVPAWVWLLAAVAGLGALFTYTRPLWSIAGSAA